MGLREPMVVQWLEALLLLEFIGYGMHRAFHEVPALWTMGHALMAG